MITKIPKEFLEKGFEYPEPYIKIIELNLLDFDYWYIMSEECALKRLVGLRQRYPERYLVPFARRDDNDDIACIDLKEPYKIQIIHDFASCGYEQTCSVSINYKEYASPKIEHDVKSVAEIKKGSEGLEIYDELNRLILTINNVPNMCKGSNNIKRCNLFK